MPAVPTPNLIATMSYRNCPTGAVDNVFPPERFIIRREEKDKGVDGSIELKQAGVVFAYLCASNHPSYRFFTSPSPLTCHR